jgi:hypothetical protein
LHTPNVLANWDANLRLLVDSKSGDVVPSRALLGRESIDLALFCGPEPRARPEISGDFPQVLAALVERAENANPKGSTAMSRQLMIPAADTRLYAVDAPGGNRGAIRGSAPRAGPRTGAHRRCCGTGLLKLPHEFLDFA